MVHICIVLYYTHSTTYFTPVYYKGTMEYKYILIHYSTCMCSNNLFPYIIGIQGSLELNIINIYWIYIQIC